MRFKNSKDMSARGKLFLRFFLTGGKFMSADELLAAKRTLKKEKRYIIFFVKEITK